MKAKWKVLAIIAAAAVVLAAGAALLAIFVIVPGNKYSDAEALLAAGDNAGAYEAFDMLEDFRDAAERKDKIQADVFATRSVESVMFIGYEWLVLEQREGKTLLLIDEALAPQVYSEVLLDTTWKDCALRSYLNRTLYAKIQEKDQALIAEAQIINSGNAVHGTPGGGSTADKLFLLSLAEAKLYFKDNLSRIARVEDNSFGAWWLRSPGRDSTCAAQVAADGSVDYDGIEVNYPNRGLRIALWVNQAAEDMEAPEEDD